MSEEDLQKIEKFCDCDPPCEACKTTMALIAEIRRCWKEIEQLKNPEKNRFGKGFSWDALGPKGCP